VLHLSDIWFIAIAVLWAGYFVLEGFDFGVGILLPVLGRTNGERRAMTMGWRQRLARPRGPSRRCGAATIPRRARRRTRPVPGAGPGAG